jgi:nucleoid-associated protein YgaU
MPSDARRRDPSNIICGHSIDVGRFRRLEQANRRKRKDRAVDSLGTDFDALLTRAACWALWVAACWALLVLVAVVLEARTRGRVRLAERAGCPPAVRLWLLTLVVTLLAGVTPAHASDTGSGSADTDRVAGALDGLALPDRAVDAPTAPRALARPVVVRPGDSLWRVVRRVLPGAPTDAAVAAGVAAVYAANRLTIGPDPDLLRPGQRLDVAPLLDFPDRTTLSEAP